MAEPGATSEAAGGQQTEEAQASSSRPAVSEEVLMHAWKVLNPEGNEKLTRTDLQRYTRLFFPKLTQADLKKLVKGSGLTYEKLRHLVANEDLEGFDTSAEAFKVLDPTGTGFADLEQLKRLLSQMPGVGEVSEEDMKVVLELADQDEDGRISLEDFAKLDRFVPPVRKSAD